MGRRVHEETKREPDERAPPVAEFAMDEVDDVETESKVYPKHETCVFDFRRTLDD